MGYKTLIENLINFSSDYSESAATNMFWYPDTADGTDISKLKYFGNDISLTEPNKIKKEELKKMINAVNDSSSYNRGFRKRWNLTQDSKTVCSIIPLSMLFGFCKYYNKAIRGVNIKVELTLNDMRNIIQQNEEEDGEYKVLIEDMGLWIPEGEPNKTTEEFIEREVVNNPTFKISWEESDVFINTQRNEVSSSWRVDTDQHKTTHIYYMQQKSDYMDNTKKTNMIFNHMDLESLHVRLNGKQYPAEELKCNFDKNDYFRAYWDFLSAGNKTHNEDSGTIVNYTDFKKLFPIFHIDVSKHPDSLYSKAQTSDIVINHRLNKAPTENYNKICMVTSERILTLNPTTLREHLIS